MKKSTISNTPPSRKQRRLYISVGIFAVVLLTTLVGVITMFIIKMATS
ncbi:MAG: hypothetical protein Q4A44_03730 [Bacteroidales bacterium]|nr:hypothetical protein [Bacteroidales bacterium]